MLLIFFRDAKKNVFPGERDLPGNKIHLSAIRGGLRMRLLTHNMLSSKGMKGVKIGFPLAIEVCNQMKR